MNPGDIVELTETYTLRPKHGGPVTFPAGKHLRVRHDDGCGSVRVTDAHEVSWVLPRAVLAVVKSGKAVRK